MSLCCRSGGTVAERNKTEILRRIEALRQGDRGKCRALLALARVSLANIRWHRVVPDARLTPAVKERINHALDLLDAGRIRFVKIRVGRRGPAQTIAQICDPPPSRSQVKTQLRGLKELMYQLAVEGERRRGHSHLSLPPVRNGARLFR